MYTTKSTIIKKFVGCITKRGKRSGAIRLFDAFLYNIKIKFDTSPLDFLDTILDSSRPKVFMISKKVAGMSHKIPVPVSKAKSYSMVIKWFISAAKKRRSSSIADSMLDELMDLYQNPNSSVLKKRDEYHRLARINRPFLRYHKF